MSSLARLASRLRSRPSYVFGRFATVRRAYALGQGVLRGRDTALTAVPLYETEGDHIAQGPSGLIVSDRSVEEHRARLADTAWSDGIRLTPEAIETLRGFAHTGPLRFRRSANSFGDAASVAELTPEERARMTTATLATAWQDPAIRAIAGDPLITEVITAYLGYRPRLAMPYFFWSFASDVDLNERVARNQTVLFHYDVQGYNFAYVSFYLYPTDRRNGAHALIEGSHNEKKLGHLLGSARLSDADAEAWYGKDRIALIEADAGEGFFEDTSCFHKALPPETGERLMLQFRYL